MRHCHGDLHLRNICLIDGTPTIFDGIEFDDRLSCIDVLYDLAFLLMDLEHRELRAFGNAALNHYLQRFGRTDGLAALPLFLSTRACVRAKVSASAGASQQDIAARARKEDEAKTYFRLAQSLLEPRSPGLLAIGGLSGTGKTILARRLAPMFGPNPGALHLRSDVIRKTLAGADELTRLPQSAYSQTMNERVYTALAEKAGEALAGGHAVIVDAIYLKPAERLFIEEVARRHAVPFHGLWLQAPTDTLLRRVANRTGDASDATTDVVRRQMTLQAGDIGWRRIDADRPLHTLIDQVQSFLQTNTTGTDRPRAAS